MWADWTALLLHKEPVVTVLSALEHTADWARHGTINKDVLAVNTAVGRRAHVAKSAGHFLSTAQVKP